MKLHLTKFSILVALLTAFLTAILIGPAAEALPLPNKLQIKDQPALSSTKAVLNLISLDAQTHGAHKVPSIKSLLPNFQGRSYLENLIYNPQSPEGMLLRHVSLHWDKKHHQGTLQIYSIFLI